MSKASKSKITSSIQNTKVSDATASWTSISADDDDQLLKIPMPTFVKLNDKKKINNKKKYENIFNKLWILWNNLFLTTVFINYFLISFTYLVWRPKHNNHALFYIAIAMDVVYFINFSLQILIMARKKKVRINFNIIQNIIVETFLLFPFWLIYEQVFNRNDGIYLRLRTISLLRVYKLFLKSNKTTINKLYKELFQLLMGFLIFIQTFTCVWFVFHCPLWTNDCKILMDIKYTSTFVEWFIISFHCVIKSSFGSGFILNGSSTENATIGIGTLISLLFIITYISMLFIFLMTSDKRILKYHLQLHQLIRHYKIINLNQTAMNRLKKYYQLMWLHKRGIKTSDLLQIAPRSVHSDVMFDMNYPALKCSLVFKNCSEVYLRYLSDLMKHECYCDGEFIYKRMEVKDKMVVVVSGVIDIMAEEDENVSIVSFGPGTSLSEAALVLSLKARCSVRAKEYVEIQALYRVDFYSTIPYYQKQQNKVTKIFKSRILEAHIRRRSNKQTFVKRVKEANFAESSLLTFYKVFKVHKYTRFIPTNSYLNKVWEIYIINNAIVISITYPYYVAFKSKFPPEFILMSMIMELTLVIDVFIHLITLGTEKDSNKINIKKLVLHKLNKIDFYLDVLSAFYFEYFAYLFNQSDAYFYLFKLNRVLKFYKVMQAFKNDFACGAYTKRILKFLVTFCFLLIWISSVAFMESCFNFNCVKCSWYALKEGYEKTNFIFEAMYGRKLKMSVYFALSHLIGFEIHNMFLIKFRDVVLSSLVSILGVSIIGFFIAYLSVVVYTRIKAKLDFLKRIDMLNELFMNTPMPKSMQNRLMSYYYAQWEYNQCFDVKQNVLFSKELEEEIFVKERIECLVQIPILSVMDEGFIKVIASKCKIYVLPPGDFVTYTGSMNKEMFVIIEGNCVYKNVAGPCKILGPNSIFGTCSLFFNIPETMIIRTVTHCKLISIDGSTLQDAIILYPSINQAIKQSYKDILYYDSNLNALSMSELNWNELTKFHFDLDAMKQFGKIPFINVVNYCSKHKELYSNPFKKLDTFYMLKFILMPVTIIPDGCFIKVWMMFRLVVAYTYGITTPIQQIISPHYVTFYYFMYFSDIVLYLDIYFMMHVCYYDDNNQLVIHPLKTALNYVKGQFVLDFVIAFPYEIIIYVVSKKQYGKYGEECVNLFYCLARLLKMLQVYKIQSAFKYWENKISKGIHVKILKYILTTIFITNLWACVLIYLTCKYITDNDSINYKQYKKLYSYQFGKPGWYYIKHSWLETFDNFTLLDVYSNAFYWTSSLMVALNFDDYAVSNPDLVVSVAIMFSGTIFFTYMIANLIPYFLQTSTKAMEYQVQLKQLMTFANLEKVDKKLKLKLKRNAEYTWRRTKNINVISLLSTLHTTLLQDTLCCFYEDTLKQVRLFEHIDRSYLRLIMMVIKPQYFLKDQIIVRGDDIIDEFYIIHRGSIQIDMNRSQIQTILSKGGLFGYFYNESIPIMTITATAATNVDVLCIKTSDFYAILKNYTVFNKKIKEVITEYKDFMHGKDSFNILHCDISSKSKKERTMCNMCTNYFFKKFEVIEFIWLMISYASCLIAILQFTFQFNKPFAVNAVLDVVISSKLVLKFYKPYYNNFGEYITSKNAIKNRYLANDKIEFLLDLVVNIIACFSHLLFYMNLDYKDVILYYTIVRLCTIVRALNIYKYFKEKEDELIENKLLLMILNLFLWSTLIIHFLANLFCIMDCSIGDCSGKRMLFISVVKDVYSRYLNAILLTINFITCGGMSKINPIPNFNKIIIGSFCIASKFVLAILIAKFINIFWVIMKANLKYGYKLIELKDYMKCANVNKFQIKKVLNYFEKSWINDLNRKWPVLLDKLPSPITAELKIALYKPILQGTYIFSGTEEQFLRNVACLLERTIYYSGNCIVYDSQIDERMYFIKKGEVEVLTFNLNLTETIHDVLHETEMFGLAQGIYTNVPHQFTFRACTRTEILSLQLVQWEHLLKFYSRSKHIIYKRVRDMHVQLNE